MYCTSASSSTGSGLSRKPWVKIATDRLSNPSTKVKTAPARIAGSSSGKVIVRRLWNDVAPRLVAASSNLRLKSGTADLNAFLASGVPVALGIDEAGLNDDRDMLQEMRLALTLHRPAGHDAPHPGAAQILRMATEHGAATTPFTGRIGRLAPGSAADIVLLDWQTVTRPWQDPAIPLVEVLIRRAKTTAVATVLIGGEVVYHEGRFTRIDWDQILNEITRVLGQPATEDELALRRLSQDLIDPVSRFYEGWLEPANRD